MFNFINSILTDFCWYVGPPKITAYGEYEYGDPEMIRCSIERGNVLSKEGLLEENISNSVGFFCDAVEVGGFIYSGVDYSDIVPDFPLENRMKIVSVEFLQDQVDRYSFLYTARMK